MNSSEPCLFFTPLFILVVSSTKSYISAFLECFLHFSTCYSFYFVYISTFTVDKKRTLAAIFKLHFVNKKFQVYFDLIFLMWYELLFFFLYLQNIVALAQFHYDEIYLCQV